MSFRDGSSNSSALRCVLAMRNMAVPMENTLKATATGANRLFISSALSANAIKTKRSFHKKKKQRAWQPEPIHTMCMASYLAPSLAAESATGGKMSEEARVSTPLPRSSFLNRISVMFCNRVFRNKFTYFLQKSNNHNGTRFQQSTAS
jgi:hypothetical protein